MFKELRIGFARTINLGNYESMRIEASVTADVPSECSNDEYAAMKASMQTELRQLLEQTYREQHKTGKG